MIQEFYCSIQKKASALFICYLSDKHLWIKGLSAINKIMRHIPRKRFGQNFLVDPQVIANIINAIHPQESDRVVEIGPGFGALTRPLLQLLDHLYAVELDRDITGKLDREFSKDKLTIYSADALKFDFSNLGKPLRVVGNLPYNVSTPILFHLSKFRKHITDMHFMLQKEVVARMVATPSTSDYGRLSVMLQHHFDMEQVFIVPPESFYPIPKVESAVVRMLPLKPSDLVVKSEGLFSRIVATAFSQRRKTLRNSLHGYLNPKSFTMLDIDPGLRAENLSVLQFVDIANYLVDINDNLSFNQ